MKLYHCWATAIDYDHIEFEVAEPEEQAYIQFKKKLDEDEEWYSKIFADEITVEGYEINVCKK